MRKTLNIKSQAVLSFQWRIRIDFDYTKDSYAKDEKKHFPVSIV